MSAFKYTRLDKTQAAILLVDHQAGLISLVQDFPPNEFKNNVLALAALAKFFKLPTILTTSFEEGPNGPIVPELKQMFPDAPYIARPGNINAWDNEDFVKAVKATGKKQLIIAGVVTDVCVAFPTLSALEEGYEVFVVTDASGTFNETVQQAAWARMSAAGSAGDARLVARSQLSWILEAGKNHCTSRHCVLRPRASPTATRAPGFFQHPPVDARAAWIVGWEVRMFRLLINQYHAAVRRCRTRSFDSPPRVFACIRRPFCEAEK
jgi:nicotinamidase-related amidase